MIGGFVQVFLDLFYFKLHDVMLNQHFFFLFGDLGEILDGHVVLQGKFLNLRVEFLL